MTVVIFLIVLAILIFVHELGHFIFAKIFKIRVDAFSIGFGPKIIVWQAGETKYSLGIIPFGGYVKIFGEDPNEESISGRDSNRSFVNKKRWQQAIVLIAGIAFNIIFAWLLYTSLFIGGVTTTVDGFEAYQDRFENRRIMITQILPNSPAEVAGLKVGDTIMGSDLNIETIQNIINGSQGQKITLQIKRNQQRQDIEIAPQLGIVNGDKYAIGIAMQGVADLRLPFIQALSEGSHYTFFMIKETTLGLYDFFISIFKGTANFETVAGPVGIAGIVGGAAEMGFGYLLMITAIISINLGIINLIPFPALDGGRILFVVIEGITRKQIPVKFVNIVNTVGFALLMILMVYVTYQDLVKLF